MSFPKKIADPRESHVADLKLISEALWQASAIQGWCTEFEMYLDTFNNNLRVELPNPRPKLSVSWTVSFRFTEDLPEGMSPAEVIDAKDVMTRKLRNMTDDGSSAPILELLNSSNVEKVTPYDLSVRTCGIRRDR